MINWSIKIFSDWGLSSKIFIYNAQKHEHYKGPSQAFPAVVQKKDIARKWKMQTTTEITPGLG